MGQSLNNLFSTINKRNEIEAMQAVQGIHQVLAEKENYLTREKLYQEKMQDKDFAKQENLRKGTMRLLEQDPEGMQNFINKNPDFKIDSPEKLEEAANYVLTEKQKQEKAKKQTEESNRLKMIIGKDVVESKGKLVTFDENGEPVDAYVAAGNVKTTPKVTAQETNLRKQASDIGIQWDENEGILENYDKIKEYKTNEKTFEELSKDSVVKNMASKTKMIDGVLHTEVPEEKVQKQLKSKFFSLKTKKTRSKEQQEVLDKYKNIGGKYYIPDPDGSRLGADMLIEDTKMPPLLTKLNEYNAAKDYLEGIKKPEETTETSESNEYFMIDGKKVTFERAKADFLAKGYNEEQWNKYLELIRNKK